MRFLNLKRLLKPSLIPRTTLYLVLALFFIIIFLQNLYASTEWVYVAKVLSNDDKDIIVRANGEAYQIDKGVGCLSFWRYEGKRVLISSPGLFSGVGSKLILPDVGQECRIWNSESLGQWNNYAPEPTKRKTYDSHVTKKETLICQIALDAMGYYSGEIDGIFGEKTKSAISSFQNKMGLERSGSLNVDTIISLSRNIQEKFPNNPKASKLAIALLNLAERRVSAIGARISSGSSSCESGHWISSVSNGGEVIILEDGSVWEVDSIDTIDTGLWLSTEEITICNDCIMINTDTGDKVGVTRIR